MKERKSGKRKPGEWNTNEEYKEAKEAGKRSEGRNDEGGGSKCEDEEEEGANPHDRTRTKGGMWEEEVESE